MKAIIAITMIIVGLGILLYYGLVQRFLNPDMTEMRLLFTFWWQYLIGVVLVVIGYTLVEDV